MKKISFLFLLFFIFPGCAIFGSKFKESKSVDFAPFAQHTMVLLSSLDYELNPSEVYLIRPYLEPANPTLLELQECVQLERVFLKGLMSYSAEILNLAESGMSQTDQVKAYQSYLSSLAVAIQAKALADVLLPDEEIKKILGLVAEKKTLLEAMQAARPLIIEFNKVNIRLIQNIATSRGKLANVIHQSIDDKFKKYVEIDLSLRSEKSDVVQGLTLLRSYRLGNGKALRDIYAIKGLLPQKLSRGDAGAIERYLADRLTVLTKRQQEIQPDLDDYRELKNKLNQIKAQHDEMIRAGGRAVLLWSTAHQQMANGKINRAEWFGLSDARDMLTGATRKVVP